MLRSLLLFILGCIVSATACAQSTFTAHIYENKARIALPGIMVSNQNNNEFVMSDDKGKFTIAAKKGDILILKGFAYKTDTLLLTSTRDLEIMLEPRQNVLKDVNVTSTETKNANPNAYKDPEFHGQSMVYQRDAGDLYKGGIALRVWYWNKQEKKLKKEADRRKYEQTSDEIVKVFSADNISQYLPLKGEDMNAFIIRYIPDVTVYSSPSFNLLAYLNTSYKNFNSLSTEERKPQKLN